MWMFISALVVGLEVTAVASSSPSINQEEQAVYETALSSWLGANEAPQLVNVELSAPPSASAPEFRQCAKGLRFSAPGIAQTSLAGVAFKRRGITLIEGSRWSPVDPGQAIREGKSVEGAVEQGNSHSLISFSRIAFTRNGNDALVNMGMVCGMLCGSGSTLHLHKSSSRWTVVGRCGGWIS